ncbi:MAG: hypothetical protein SF182_08700, partial [Deltaproteobacteria bacterium]|nr:hypothetical protein [Deltaproteobacteria bacterium]
RPAARDAAPPARDRAGTPVRRLAGIVLRLLAPAPTSGWLACGAALGLFALGAGLAFSWVQSGAELSQLAVLIAGLAGLALLAMRARAPWLRALAVAPLVLCHLAWLYIALGLGTLLAWTTTAALRWAVAALALLAVGGALPARARFRLPTALPLGVWIVACLIGWQREDGVVRCDDYLAVRAAGLTLLVETTEELRQCQPGEVLRIGHYPRRTWEAPEGDRLVITTQRGIGGFDPPGRAVADRLPGIICDVPLNGAAPACFGDGKAQGLIEAPDHDRLLVAAWQQKGPRGERGALFVLPRRAPLQPLARVLVPESSGELFYDPRGDLVGLLTDEGEVMRPVRLSDGAVLDAVPAPIIPGDVRYDAAQREGVICFAAGPLRSLDGEPFLSVAFRGDPFAIRPLGGGPSAWLSMVWGCDWDAHARRVYVADASLGLLDVVDYDSGAVLRRIPIEICIRYVARDPQRGLLYLANFLRGDVVALDVDAGRVVRRWFAGRFVRGIELSRDRQALLVTSNLGVVRIPLADLPAAPPAP